MLFALFKTDTLEIKQSISKDSLWEMIQQSCIRSCGYFITIQMHEHRNAWADLLCFALTSILKLPKSNVSSNLMIFIFMCCILTAGLSYHFLNILLNLFVFVLFTV